MPGLPQVKEVLLLPLQLPEVVVSPQRTDLKNVFEVGELLEDLIQVVVLDAVELRVLA